MIPLSSGEFLQVAMLINDNVRMVIKSSDFKHTLLSKCFCFNFSLPYTHMRDDRLRILPTSNGKIVMSCKSEKSTTRIYVLDEKLNLLSRKDLDFKFHTLSANKHGIFGVPEANVRLLTYDFHLNQVREFKMTVYFGRNFSVTDSNLFYFSGPSFGKILVYAIVDDSLKRVEIFDSKVDYLDIVLLDSDCVAFMSNDKKSVFVENVRNKKSRRIDLECLFFPSTRQIS